MLRLHDVSKSFDGLAVVSDFSLDVHPGEIVALIGSSGCGKTTLLNMICGLSKPDSGTVDAQGARVSYMFQGTRLLPWRTVEQNIKLVRDDAQPEKLASLIGAVGLEGFEGYYPKQLSGGMARRCALARAFYFGGDLFLMDEPFSGLDYGIRMEMVRLLLSIWKVEKPGVLFVTHEIDEALMVATRIAVLSPRPATVVEWVELPGGEGRDASSQGLARIRQDIIHRITC
nr:ABC transporter ATP-binding protein [Curtanaerobium respiraculi]